MPPNRFGGCGQRSGVLEKAGCGPGSVLQLPGKIAFDLCRLSSLATNAVITNQLESEVFEIEFSMFGSMTRVPQGECR